MIRILCNSIDCMDFGCAFLKKTQEELQFSNVKQNLRFLLSQADKIKTQILNRTKDHSNDAKLENISFTVSLSIVLSIVLLILVIRNYGNLNKT